MEKVNFLMGDTHTVVLDALLKEGSINQTNLKKKVLRQSDECPGIEVTNISEESFEGI